MTEEEIARLVAERDMYRADSALLNEVALRMGEALGYPSRFTASPLDLVDQVIAAKLETRIISEPIPDHAMYAVVIRGRYRFLVQLAEGAVASWDMDYPHGFGDPGAVITTFTLKGRVVGRTILGDHENPTFRTPTQIPAAPAAITTKETR
ncbi:hypothetical protein [Leifsonia sp. NPDC058248]|uniref:hypothetical protein n=1 Tax=Leifsonia sp. NPDC058248 TaxID=3346402 RepID=UPI0036D89CC8